MILKRESKLHYEGNTPPGIIPGGMPGLIIIPGGIMPGGMPGRIIAGFIPGGTPAAMPGIPGRIIIPGGIIPGGGTACGPPSRWFRTRMPSRIFLRWARTWSLNTASRTDAAIHKTGSK